MGRISKIPGFQKMVCKIIYKLNFYPMGEYRRL